jgi:hypothetical protein
LSGVDSKKTTLLDSVTEQEKRIHKRALVDFDPMVLQEWKSRLSGTDQKFCNFLSRNKGKYAAHGSYGWPDVVNGYTKGLVKYILFQFKFRFLKK